MEKEMRLRVKLEQLFLRNKTVEVNLPRNAEFFRQFGQPSDEATGRNIGAPNYEPPTVGGV